MIPPPAIAGAPHRRYDPLRDAWVLVSAGRTGRPWQGGREPEPAPPPPAYDPACYLCPGNVRANGAQNPAYTGTWTFTNDFAALRPETGTDGWAQGLLRAEGAAGTSRVLVFSPRHDRTLASLDDGAIEAVVAMWAEESAALGARWPWVQVFENRGAEMGASNPHPHGQVWAGSALPGEAAREDASQRAHHARTGRPLLLDLLDEEAGGPRIVDEDEDWVLLLPFWAVWPFETLLVPRRPVARLPELDAPARRRLAAFLGRTYRRYDTLFARPCPFSIGWHQAPFGADAGHWQLHAHTYPPLLRPQVRKFMVGYELLSEAQRDLTAEEAAERLRAAGPGPAPTAEAAAR